MAADSNTLEQPLPNLNLGEDMMSSFGNVPVTIQVILGSAQLPLNRLLSLKAGSLVELDERLGEPVCLFVNGCKIAMGELFVLDGEGDKLGVKITSLLPAQSQAQ